MQDAMRRQERAGAGRTDRTMHSIGLQQTLTEFAEAAATRLQADVLGGAEVPFEVESQATRRGLAVGRRERALFYSYRAMTGEFIDARRHELERLPSYAPAARALSGFDGLDRYLASAGIDPAACAGPAKAGSALRALLRDIFHEQTDFELHPERLADALSRVEQATLAGAGGVTLVATLHGLLTTSTELALTPGLRLAHPDSLIGLPEGAASRGGGEAPEHLVAVFAVDEQEPLRGIEQGREVLKDLLRSLRLFGDGRVTLGALAWARVGTGGWNAVALGTGGRPHGMLVVTEQQEDELRAFCNLVSRRAPQDNALAWALARFEMGCAREHPYEALSDHLLALRALLEPEGPASGMLPGRLAALCATEEDRPALLARTIDAIELEQQAIEGVAVPSAAGDELARSMGEHLRGLLRDVICGHLRHDLVGHADGILQAGLAEAQPEPAMPDPRASAPESLDSPELLQTRGPMRVSAAVSAEQMLSDLGQSEEILDLFI